MKKIILTVAILLAACGDNNETPACVANGDATAENVCAQFFGPDAQTFTCDNDMNMDGLASSVGMSACETNRGITCCY